MLYSSAFELAERAFKIGRELQIYKSSLLHNEWVAAYGNLQSVDWSPVHRILLKDELDYSKSRKAQEDSIDSRCRSFQGEIEFYDKDGKSIHSDMCGTVEVLNKMVPLYIQEFLERADFTKPWKIDGGWFCAPHSEQNKKEFEQK